MLSNWSIENFDFHGFTNFGARVNVVVFCIYIRFRSEIPKMIKIETDGGGGGGDGGGCDSDRWWGL